MRRSHVDEPLLITTARESSDDEYDRRRKRYAIMMALRAVCVIVAALSYRVSIWIAIVCLVAGAVLPWCAVLIANDRPPKKRTRIGVPIVGNERALPPGSDDRTTEG